MDEYYAAFDVITNKGYVFHYDWSDDESLRRERLSSAEVTDREEWQQKLKQIYDEYQNKLCPELTSLEDVLCQRLLPPRLAISSTSSRTSLTEPRSGRLYPPPKQFQAWKGFIGLVDSYTCSGNLSNVRAFRDFFARRIDHANVRACRSEAQETYYLIESLEMSLKESGIVGEISTSGISIGKADFVFSKDESTTTKPTIIGEFKSTQNLLLPVTAFDVVKKYKKAYSEVVIRKKERTIHWSCICHPIGQLLGYMVDINCRYGALTSATRTYFVFIEGNGEDATARISEPYFPGEKNYLRAWAYVHSLGAGSGDDFRVPTSGKGQWLKTSRMTPTPNQQKRSQYTRASTTSTGKRKRSSTEHTTRNKQCKTTLLEFLPWVPYSEIVIDTKVPLGSGRNGTVFRCQWGEMTVALKQFDVRREIGFDAFQREIAAYSRLADAWGKFVPTPFFLSESPSGGVLFLALQLGRYVEDDDQITEKQCQNLLRKLRAKYGIDHNDPGGNFVIIENKKGKQCLAVIDFEDWDDVS